MIAIASREVAVAARSGQPRDEDRAAARRRCRPPTPKKAENTPAASPMATRRTGVSYEHGQSGRPPRDPARRRSRCFGRRRAHAADRHCDVRRRARPTALSRALCVAATGCACERRADALRERPAAAALLRRARRRRATAEPVRRRSRRFARAWRDRRTSSRRARTSSACHAVYDAGRARRPSAAATTASLDTGIRCVRAPCFSYRAGQVNGRHRRHHGLEVDLAGVQRRRRRMRAHGRAGTKNGLYARGRFASTAGRRPRVPRAAALPQSAAASRLSTSQANRTSSSRRPEVPDREPELVAVGEARVGEEHLARVVHALEQPLVVLVRALTPEAHEREVPRRRHLPACARRAPSPRRAARAGGARESAPAARASVAAQDGPQLQRRNRRPSGIETSLRFTASSASGGTRGRG